MSAEKKAILDISGDNLTLVVQDAKYVGNVVYRRTSSFSGYAKGEFFDVDELFGAVSSLVEDCRNTTFSSIGEIWVGVPGEFTTVCTKTIDKSLGSIRKVNQYDVDKILEDTGIFGDNADFIPVNCSPIFFVGDDGKKTIDPMSITTSTLTAYVSYVLCKRAFCTLFDKLGKQIGVKFEYTSTILAEVLCVVPQQERDNAVILADVGYISTSVAYAKGDGILSLASFSEGSGHIAGDLVKCMNNGRGIPYLSAKELVAKLNFNLEPKPGDSYSVMVGDKSYSYPIAEVNEISRARVEQIAERINKAITQSAVEVRPGAGILLTGSGLSEVVGAKEIIEEITQRPVVVIAPQNPDFSKPGQSSLASLLWVQQRKMDYGGNKVILAIKKFIDKTFRRN